MKKVDDLDKEKLEKVKKLKNNVSPASKEYRNNDYLTIKDDKANAALVSPHANSPVPSLGLMTKQSLNPPQPSSGKNDDSSKIVPVILTQKSRKDMSSPPKATLASPPRTQKLDSNNNMNSPQASFIDGNR